MERMEEETPPQAPTAGQAPTTGAGQQPQAVAPPPSAPGEYRDTYCWLIFQGDWEGF